MRWRAAFEPRDDGEPEHAIVEAESSAEAVQRLREVIGTETGVLYVLPEDDAVLTGETYEDFLRGPGAGEGLR